MTIEDSRKVDSIVVRYRGNGIQLLLHGMDDWRKGKVYGRKIKEYDDHIPVKGRSNAAALPSGRKSGQSCLDRFRRRAFRGI